MSKFAISFIDDFPRKTLIYFLRSMRSQESLLRFQEFKALVENQTRKKIKVLRSDSGVEYNSHAFDDFCRKEGIRRQLTVPSTTQQNGVDERKNRLIVGAVRAMLHDQSLPFFLLVEACSTTIFVQNRSLHCAKLLRRYSPGRSLR